MFQYLTNRLSKAITGLGFAVLFSRAPTASTAQPKPPQPLPQVQPEQSGNNCNSFTFDASGSYDPDQQGLSFLWNFGDGTSSNEPVVTHTFEKAGQYTVTLTVVDSSGVECDTAITSQVVKANAAPDAVFKASESGCVGQAVSFDASPTVDDTPQR